MSPPHITMIAFFFNGKKAAVFSPPNKVFVEEFITVLQLRKADLVENLSLTSARGNCKGLGTLSVPH